MAKTDNTNPRSYKRTVDWGAIGKQFTDAIVDTKTKQTETAKKSFEAQKERTKIEKEREDKRKTYEEEEAAYEGKALAARSDVRSVFANVPSLQQITLDITNQAVKKRNDMYEQFKKGKISERDWLVARQNVNDGFKTYFGLIKDYGAVKENAEKSIAAGGSKAITEYFVGQLESLQNTENLEVSFTDNGQWNASYKNAADNNKKTTVPLAQLNVFGRVNFNGFNVEQVASTIDQQLGTILKGGKYTQSQGKVYGENLELLLTEKLEGPANAPTTAALIMDVLNGSDGYRPEGGFKLVMDKGEYTEDGNNILIVTETPTGVPTFQIPENAMALAREYLAKRVKGLENSSFKVIRVKGKDPKPLPPNTGKNVSFVPLSSDRELFTKLIAYEDKIKGGEERSSTEIASDAILEQMFPIEERDEVKALLGGEFDNQGNLSVKGDKFYRPAVVRYLANTGFLPPGTKLITEDNDGVLRINREALEKADQYVEGVTTGTITLPSGTGTGIGSKYNP